MRWPTSPSSVAENNIVCVRPVQWRRIHSTCGVNPSSAIRSASSSTTTSTSANETSSDFSRSISRSGVATTISTPSLELVDLVVPAGPAVHGEDPLAGVVGDRFEHLGDLDGELAGGHQDEPERAASARPRRGCGRASARRTRASCPSRCGPGRRRRGPAWRLGSPRSGSRTAGRTRPRRGRRRCGRDAEVGEAGRRLDGRHRGMVVSAEVLATWTGWSEEAGRRARRRRRGAPRRGVASVMVAARVAGRPPRGGRSPPAAQP